MKSLVLFIAAAVLLGSTALAQEFVDMTGTYSTTRGCHRGGFKYTMVYVQASSSAIVVTFDNPQAEKSVFGPSFFTLSLGNYNFTLNNSPAVHRTTVSQGGTKVTSSTTAYGTTESTSIALAGDVLTLVESGRGRGSQCSFRKVSDDVSSIPESPFRRRRQ